MEKEQLQDINKMSKTDLRIELDDLRREYKIIKLREDIIKMINRIDTTDELEKIKKFTEKQYNDSYLANFGYLSGMRDNIQDMAENLAEIQNINELRYFNGLMYGLLLDREPDATDGLYMTPGMESMLLKHLQKKGA